MHTVLKIKANKALIKLDYGIVISNDKMSTDHSKNMCSLFNCL